MPIGFVGRMFVGFNSAIRVCALFACSAYMFGASLCAAQTITKVSDLSFGKIVRGTTNSVFRLATSGIVTCNGTLICLGSTSVAVFNISGTNNTSVTISVAPSTILTAANGSTLATTLLLSRTSLVVRKNNTNTFKVGGTFSVSPTQPAGAYAGTFMVTVNYQ